LYVFRNANERWVAYRGWLTELTRLQQVASRASTLNLNDPSRTSVHRGWAKKALVSERHVTGVTFEDFGGANEHQAGTYFGTTPYRSASYDDITGATLFPIGPEAHSNRGGIAVKEVEVIHTGGDGAQWSLDMFPQVSHGGGLTGFRLHGAGGHVRARLTNLVDPLGRRPFPGLGSIRRVSGSNAASVAVNLEGTMAGISTPHLVVTPFGGGSAATVEFHIYVNGFMPPGLCTIGASGFTLPTGWVWDIGLTTEYLPMDGPDASRRVFPLWVEVDLPNESRALAHGADETGQTIYTSGILPDTNYCTSYVTPHPTNLIRADENTAGLILFADGSGHALGLRTVIARSFPGGLLGEAEDSGVRLFGPGYNAPVDGTLENFEEVEIAVNTRGFFDSGGSRFLKTYPFVKHPDDPDDYDDLNYESLGRVPTGEITEIVVQRQPVLVDDYYVMPRLPDNPTGALVVEVGYYAAGAVGTFRSLGIIINLAANVNVARWNGFLVMNTTRPLVYRCAERVNITAQWTLRGGTGFNNPDASGLSPAAWPLYAEYYLNTQRLIALLT
jgi:hypothetical protein